MPDYIDQLLAAPGNDRRAPQPAGQGGDYIDALLSGAPDARMAQSADLDYGAYRAQIGDPVQPGTEFEPGQHFGMIAGGPEGSPDVPYSPPRHGLGTGDPVIDARAETELMRPRGPVQAVPGIIPRLGEAAGESVTSLLGINDEIGGAAAATAQAFQNAGEAVSSLISGEAPEYGDIGEAYDYGAEKARQRRGIHRREQPVTTAAGDVLSIATTMPAKGMQAMGLMQGAKQATKAGALFGGVAGAGHADGGVVDRAVGAGVGTAAGAVTGFGLGLALPPLVQGIGKLTGMGVNAVKRLAGGGTIPAAKLTGTEQRALNKVFKAFMDDGISPAETMKRLRTWRAQGGAPAQLVDLGGENVKRLARAIGTAGGPGATSVQNEAERRIAMQADEISNALVKTLSGKGDDYLAAVSQLDAMRKGIADPLYKAAYPDNVNLTPRMRQLLQRPHMQNSVRRAAADLLDAGDDPAMHGFIQDAQGRWTLGGKRATVKALDFIKNATDDILEGRYRNPVTGKLDLDKRGNIWNQNLRELLKLADDQSPAYAAAREAYAGPSKSMDALNFGRGILKGDYQGARQRWSRMSQGEREYARAGAVEAIRDRIDRIRDTGNKAAAILRDENTRKRLRLLFDDDASWQRFENMVRREADRIDTATFMRPDVGSQTAPRKEDVVRYGLRSKTLEDLREGKPVRSILGGVTRRVTDPLIDAAQRAKGDKLGVALADVLFSDPRAVVRGLAAQQTNRAPMTAGQRILGGTPAGGYAAGELMEQP